MTHLNSKEPESLSLKRHLIKGFVCLVFVLLVLVLVPTQVEAEEPVSTPEYDQSEQAYLISNLEELNYIREDLDNNYILTDDIDASKTQSWNDGKGWNPIGNKDKPFVGTFEGKGYKIRNISINRPQDEYIGFFGTIGDDGTVSNPTIVGAEVVGSRNVGSLAGHNRGKILNSDASGVTEGSKNVGSLVGYNQSLVKDSSASVDVLGEKNVGGLVGYNAGSAILTRSYAIGNVEGQSSVGGLVGFNSDGGFNGEKATLRMSYAKGDVLGDYEVGGLVGTNFGRISVSYARGNVEGNNYVGGLAGSVRPYSEVDESYSTGNVNGENSVGGFTGYTNHNAKVTNSYWSRESSGLNNSNGGVGLNDARMKGRNAQDSMSGFDFNGTWDVIKNDYPIISSLKESEDNDDETNSVAEYVSYTLSQVTLLLNF